MSTHFFSQSLQGQPYQKIRSNPQPFLLSILLLAVVLNTVAFFHQLTNTPFPFILTIVFLIIFFQWFYYLHIETNYEGVQTAAVATNARFGFILFILSEVLFFSCFFGSFFYYATNLTPESGFAWPPVRFTLIDPLALPFLNTIILLTSSVTVTWAHAALINARQFEASIALFLTILCGCIFLLGQIYEYNNSFFMISSSVYGSLFYLLTGFHGFHVFCGTLFLFNTLILLLSKAFSTTRHLTFEFAAWYWHFVDVVWLFVYSLLYLWSIPVLAL